MAQIDERARSLNEPDEPEEPEEGDEGEEGEEADPGGVDPEGGQEDLGEEGDQEPGDGGDEGQSPSPARDRGAPALSAGLILGAVLYTVVIQLIRGGTPQLKGWVSAKFINKPWAGSTGTPT